ncbi:MAG: hypothetical protein D6677_07425 [Calditrichaeota bacterium]|nr:MAG: hypothetical protein D6677_07425 [Calditrichota bacterium]
MMRFRTELHVKKSPHALGYDDSILSLGSCFAEHIGEGLRYRQFRTCVNPHGVLYNPHSIRDMLRFATQESDTPPDWVWIQHDGLWHSFWHDSRFSSPDRDELERRLRRTQRSTQKFLQQSRYWLITLGTAWVYAYKPSGRVVANCHKVPQQKFNRYRLSVEAITELLEEIIALRDQWHPDGCLIFSVSPVRHLKDGFHANNLSKAALHLALENVCSDANKVFYFPAYELLTDDLRDYRFYADDLLHPSSLAVAYIWQAFARAWISESAFEVMHEVEQIQKGWAHRPIVPDHPDEKARRARLRQRMEVLQQRYPFMRFTRPDTPYQNEAF